MNNKTVIPLIIAGGAIALYVLSRSDKVGNMFDGILSIIPSALADISLPSIKDAAFIPTTSWHLNPSGLDLLDESERTLVKKAWNKAQPYMSLIVEYGREFNVYVPLILAIILVESAFNPNAKRYEPRINQSSIGLMQILPNTAKSVGFFGTEEELFNPINNLRYGIKYIAHQLNRYNRDQEKTVAAYNAGTAMYNSKGEFINQGYVNNALRNYNIFNTALAKR